MFLHRCIFVIQSLTFTNLGPTILISMYQSTMQMGNIAQLKTKQTFAIHFVSWKTGFWCSNGAHFVFGSKTFRSSPSLCVFPARLPPWASNWPQPIKSLIIELIVRFRVHWVAYNQSWFASWLAISKESCKRIYTCIRCGIKSCGFCVMFTCSNHLQGY